MKRLPKEKRERIIMTAVVTLVAIIGVWYGLVRPQQNVLKTSRQKVEDTREKFTTANRRASQVEKFQKELEMTSEQLRQVEDTMATGDMYSWIIKTMSRVQADHDVQIPNFNPPAQGEVRIFAKFPYQAATYVIHGTAHFHDLGKFIADLENRFPSARVQNVELDAGGGGGTGAANSEKLTFKFEFVTLVKPNNSL